MVGRQPQGQEEAESVKHHQPAAAEEVRAREPQDSPEAFGLNDQRNAA